MQALLTDSGVMTLVQHGLLLLLCLQEMVKVLEEVNYAFTCVYVIEAALKVS